VNSSIYGALLNLINSSIPTTSDLRVRGSSPLERASFNSFLLALTIAITTLQFNHVSSSFIEFHKTSLANHWQNWTGKPGPDTRASAAYAVSALPFFRPQMRRKNTNLNTLTIWQFFNTSRITHQNSQHDNNGGAHGRAKVHRLSKVA
jgi:hypothetical protein